MGKIKINLSLTVDELDQLHRVICSAGLGSKELSYTIQRAWEEYHYDMLNELCNDLHLNTLQYLNNILETVGYKYKLSSHTDFDFMCLLERIQEAIEDKAPSSNGLG
jgi:hypothetical protein